ncbi:MAG: thioredoxin family protein [Candidatus Calescibacterium sp.]|nr:thioredoxin family protein [Candidatus Calescibacterium sp.]
MFLTDEDRTEIKKQLGEMKNEMELLLFSQKIGCEYCSETEQLLKELVDTLPNLKLVIYNPVLDEDISKKYNIGKELPVIGVRSQSNPYTANVRFLGIPAAYEFTWLLSLINMVANDRYPLQESTANSIREMDQMLDNNSAVLELWVFVTPTCPYCPIMTINSTAVALLSKNVRAVLVEVSEFPEFAQRYSIMGVPKTVFKLIKQDKVFEASVEGALPENKFVDKLVGFVQQNLK